MRQNVIKQIIYWQNNAISVSDKNWLLDRQLSVSGVLNKKREKTKKQIINLERIRAADRSSRIQEE